LAERIFKTEGLVLRTRVLGEADRLITLLTLNHGKFAAVARGARKIKSKLAAGVDIFTYGTYTFHRGRTWPIITGLDTIERFPWFREDPELYPYGSYMAELTDRLVIGEEPSPAIFELLLDGWRMLGESKEKFLLCRAFELKLAHSAGYSPCLDFCAMCGSDNWGSEKGLTFSPREGGLLCFGCQGAGLIKLDSGTVALARRLLETPLSQVKMIRPSTRQKQELTRMNSLFLAYHLDLGDLKSRHLLSE